MMKFHVYRDCDARLRLRKVVVELHNEHGCLIDRRRMFAGPFFALRLNFKKQCMLKLAAKMFIK